MNAVLEEKKPDQQVIVADTAYSKRDAVPVPAGAQPGNLMQALSLAAADPRMDIVKVKELFAMHKEVKASAAKEAFVAAVAAFKANPPTVYKDKDNAQYKSKYTSIGNLVNTVNAALSPHGLATRWNINQADAIEVTCFLTHAMGHSEYCTMKGPADTSGQKNPLQQIKSTVTYLKIATFEAVTGVASAEANSDDDGNGGGNGKQLADGVAADHLAAIDGAANEDELKARFGEAYKAANAIGDKGALRLFTEHKDARKKALGRKS